MIGNVVSIAPRKRLATPVGGPASLRPTRDQQIYTRTRDLIVTGKQLIREDVWPSAKAISDRTSHSLSVIEREKKHLDRLKRVYVRKWNKHPKQWVDPARRAADAVPPPECRVPVTENVRGRAQLDHALDVIEKLKRKHAASAAAKDARIAELEQENAFLLADRRPVRIRTLLEDRAAKHDAHRPGDAVPVVPKKDARRNRPKDGGSD